MISTPDSARRKLQTDDNLQHTIATRLKLSHLRVLLEVARQQSVSKAAATLHLAQPAVTKTLKEVEAIFGTPLFERRPRGVALNEAGQIVLPHVQTLFAELHRVGDELSAYRNGFGGMVTVGGTMAALPYLLPKTVTSFTRHASSSTIRVVEGTIHQMLDGLMRGEIDIVIGRVLADPSSSQLVQEIVFDDPFVPVVRPGHPLTRQIPAAPAELFTYPWILAPEGNAGRSTVERYMIKHRVQPPFGFVETVSFQATLGIIENSDSIAVLPRHLANICARKGELTIIGPTFPEGSLSVGLTYRRDKPLPPMATALARFFRQIVRELE
jgi:DNA-binding transcriptional LysR family regulator